jgi:hypothetical protein
MLSMLVRRVLQFFEVIKEISENVTLIRCEHIS